MTNVALITSLSLGLIASFYLSAKNRLTRQKVLIKIKKPAPKK
jgi:hypothetical protein